MYSRYLCGDDNARFHVPAGLWIWSGNYSRRCRVRISFYHIRRAFFPGKTAGANDVTARVKGLWRMRTVDVRGTKELSVAVARMKRNFETYSKTTVHGMYRMYPLRVARLRDDETERQYWRYESSGFRLHVNTAMTWPIGNSAITHCYAPEDESFVFFLLWRERFESELRAASCRGTSDEIAPCTFDGDGYVSCGRPSVPLHLLRRRKV